MGYWLSVAGGLWGWGLKILVQHLADVNEVPLALPVAQSEEDILSPIKRRINIWVSLVANGGDLTAGVNQAAH
ncbi:hypothetical protein ES703_118932 [subsurface metagenome]